MTTKTNRGGSRQGREESSPDAPADTRTSEEKRATTTPSSWRFSGRGLGVLVLVGLLAAGGYYGFQYWEARQAAQMAQQGQGQPPAPAVTVSRPLQREMAETSVYSGQFEARESVQIRARVSGYLETVDFSDGQLVKKGDLLFVIEPRPYEIALESAKAQVSETDAALDLAKVQLTRTEQLREKDHASVAQYDERVAQLSQAQAAVDSANAALNQAQLNLDYTHVHAPVSGRVGRHEVSIGNLVLGGTGDTTLLTTIVSLEPIWFTFYVSEGDGMAYKRSVQSGRVSSPREGPIPVEGQLTDETEWTLKGEIDFVDNQYSRSTGTIRVRATFSNPDLFITPGQFGRIRVPISEKQMVMLVPEAAIVTDQAVKMLFTVNDEDEIVPKPVELGQTVDGGLRMIRSGIEPSDRVVINGLMRARPGQKVTPQPGEVETTISAR
jgi:RND family efflux transporter MFP subunit